MIETAYERLPYTKALLRYFGVYEQNGIDKDIAYGILMKMIHLIYSNPLTAREAQEQEKDRRIISHFIQCKIAGMSNEDIDKDWLEINSDRRKQATKIEELNILKQLEDVKKTLQCI